MRAAARGYAVLAVAAVVSTCTGTLAATTVERSVLPVLTGVVGVACVLAVVVAALRFEGRARFSWSCIAVSEAASVLFLLGALQGAADGVVWVLLRGLAHTAAMVGLLSAPNVARPLRRWALAMLDGYLVACATFLAVWVAIRATLDGAGPVRDVAPLLWVPLDVLALSLTVGLAVRAVPALRAVSTVVVLTAAGVVATDGAWALLGDVAVGVGGWIAALMMIATAAWMTPQGVWVVDEPAGERLQLGRLSQAFAVSALVLALLVERDRVVVTATLTLLAALAVQLGVVYRQNVRLWDAVASQADHLDALLRDSRDAVLQVLPDGTVTFASDAVADVFGVPAEEFVGTSLGSVLHPDDLDEADRVTRALAAGQVRSVLVRSRVRHADGTWRWTESTVSLRAGGALPGFTTSVRDTTDREALAAELRRRARTDALTGLLSRAAFLSLVDARLDDGPCVVLFLDLDGFKEVNDTAGHAAGDEMLRSVAVTLEARSGDGGVVARLGGDEFAVLAQGADLADGLALGRQLVAALQQAVPAATGRTVASIGVARADGGNAEALVGDADLAMYAAKSRGGGCVVAFEPWMRAAVLERSARVVALDRSLRTGDGLQLHLQPVVDLRGGRRVGYEALVRWEGPEGLREPAAFVPLAEETGQIVPLGAWVLGAALDWLASCGDDRVGVSVNVADRQLAEPDFPDLVARELARTGVDPQRLTLEVTEQTAIVDLTRTGARLGALRARGVHVSLDDFGTGFSSLGYLAQLPVDELKIDRRFVAGLGTVPEDAALVRAVLGLAADLGLRVVAEGVETPAQANVLRRLGCRHAQGRLFRAPAPAASLRLVGGHVGPPRGAGTARTGAAGG